MDRERVSVIEFTKPGGNYRTGDKAGFPPETAAEYVKRGFAKMLREDVPKVDPSIVVTDITRQIGDLRSILTGAEREAKAMGDNPTAAASAAATLETAAAAKRAIDALSQQLIEAGVIPNAEGGRQQSARTRAV